MSITFHLRGAFGADRAPQWAWRALGFHATETCRRDHGVNGRISASPWEGYYLETHEGFVESAGPMNSGSPSDPESFGEHHNVTGMKAKRS